MGRVAVVIVDASKKDSDGKAMGFTLRELKRQKEQFDEWHMHARVVIKRELLRKKSEAEVQRIIAEEEGRALALLQVCFKKDGASGTTITYDATLCEEGQLEDYIIGVLQSKRVAIDVLVLGFKFEDSKRTNFLSSLHAVPGAAIGPGKKAETMLERLSEDAQCSVFHVYKDGPKLKRVVFNGPRRTLSEVPSEGEVVDPREASSSGSFPSTPRQRPNGLQASISLPAEGPTSPPISGHFQPASFSVPPGSHFPQSAALHSVPGGYAPGPQFFPAVVRSPGHTGPVALPPGYQYVVVQNGFSPGQGGASAPPLYAFQNSPPQFVSGNSSSGSHHGSPAPGYSHHHQGGGFQPHMYGGEFGSGHAGGSAFPPGFVAAPGSGYSVVQPNGVNENPGEDWFGRATSSAGGRGNGQLSTGYHTVPEQSTGAIPERARAQELPSYTVYSLQELTEATKNFSQELGGGGFGTVYLGTLRGTQVAVKKMNPEGLQGPAQFECEVKLLTTLRHRNIVILMGCCPEAFCLVYEYCAQGSLEKRLADDTQPLPWYTRVRILHEIATADLWMHKHEFIHCDIKLANMLLDENHTAKLGDVGISRMKPSAYTQSALVTAALTGSRASSTVRGSIGYLDPALLGGFSLEESSDVYALGVCLLQLLTKLPAGAVKRDVHRAYVRREMPAILDRSAGDWPLDTVVEDLTNLGLRCTEFDQDKRPDLETEVIPVLARIADAGRAAERQELEGLRRAAAEMAALRAPGARPRDNSDIMNDQFHCPLSLAIMKDPVVAADGHTYERSFIETWLANSRISPATNLPLPNTNLVANLCVKSAILEWSQRTGVQAREMTE